MENRKELVVGSLNGTKKYWVWPCKCVLLLGVGGIRWFTEVIEINIPSNRSSIKINSRMQFHIREKFTK